MPNWCSNTVIVDGGAKEIARFVRRVKTTESSFSFQAILPMPKELERTQSPANVVSQEEYKKWQAQAEFNPHHAEQMVITQEMSDTLIVKHGADNWYDWKIANWGTKWDCHSDEVVFLAAPTHLRYTFDTAWSPPTGIYEELINEFPRLTINWHYQEENMELIGNLATDEDYDLPPKVDAQLSTMQFLKSLQNEIGHANV